MELVKTILVLIIVYLLHKIYTHQDYDVNLIEGICSGPDADDPSINTEEECTSRGQGYTWNDNTDTSTDQGNNPQSNLPYETWKLPDKDGNMIELKNIRPWKELTNNQIQERQSDLPLSGALTINDSFRQSYTGDEGPFKANESIATLLEQTTLDPPSESISGQQLQDYYAEKCYEKVISYNNRGQPTSEYGDPKPIAFRINSYTPNENLIDSSISVEDPSKVSTCEILGTKELDPRFKSNKNDWTKKYPIITPLGNLTQQDVDMNNKYPENIFSGCYAFIESEDGSKRQVLVPSNVDNPSETDARLAPTKYYDHCLALNGSCGTGGGVYVDNKWVPGENCHGYGIPGQRDHIAPGKTSGSSISTQFTNASKYNIKLSPMIDAGVRPDSKYSPEKKHLITPFGRDSYSDLQVKYKRNIIRNSIPGIKLQGPYYWKGPKINSSSSDSILQEATPDQQTLSSGTLSANSNVMQSPNIDKSQPGNFGSKYQTRHSEQPYQQKKSPILGENFSRDTMPAFWDTTYSEDPRPDHGGAKQIYTLNDSNCDNKWFDGTQSDFALGRTGIDDGDNITIDEIPNLSLMDGPSKYINSRFSGINNFRKTRTQLVDSTYGGAQDAGGIRNSYGPNFGWQSRGQEVNDNTIMPAHFNPDPITPILINKNVLPVGADSSTISRSDLLAGWNQTTLANESEFVDATRCQNQNADSSTAIYSDNSNFTGTVNPTTLPKCSQATKCRCRPSPHTGSDPSKCYVDTAYCGIDQGIQECNKDDLETTRTNKTYKKWTVKDKDGNDLVIQNLVPSITTGNQLSIDSDGNNSLVIHKTVLDEAPAHLRNYNRSKSYDIDMEKEKESREKLQEYYASECSKIAKTYPNSSGFAVNNFEKNPLLNKRDGLGRCISFNNSIRDHSPQFSGYESANESSFKPCNSDTDCGFFSNEDTNRIDRNLKESPTNKYDLDRIHSTGLQFPLSNERGLSGLATYTTAPPGWTLYNKVGETVWGPVHHPRPSDNTWSAEEQGVSGIRTASTNARNTARSGIEICMSLPTGLRNSNIGESNSWRGSRTLNQNEMTRILEGEGGGMTGSADAVHHAQTSQNPRAVLGNNGNSPVTSNWNPAADSHVRMGGNRHSYDILNSIVRTDGLILPQYNVTRNIDDEEDFGSSEGAPNRFPLNQRREGVNPTLMPWSLNETQSMINDIKVSSYGLFGEWDHINVSQYEGKSNVLLEPERVEVPGVSGHKDWTKPTVRAAEKRIDDILHGTDPNGNPSQHSLVGVEKDNPNPVCIIYGKGMEDKYDKYPIPSSISAVNNSGIMAENHNGWQKQRTYNKNSIKGTQLPCISNNPADSLIPILNDDGSISASDQLNNNNPGKGSISCKEMGIHASTTKDALINAAQHWHDESGIPIYGENRALYGSFGNDRLTNLYPTSGYSKKGDDGVSHYTKYKESNDGLVKWKDDKIKTHFGYTNTENSSPPTPLHEYRGDIKNPIDARKPENQIQAEWSQLQVYRLESEKTPEEIENDRIKQEDQISCGEMWLDSPTSKMTGPTKSVNLRKNIKDENLNNSPGVLEHGKKGNTCGGCYKPEISSLSTSIRMQVDSDRDGRSDQCYVNNTCDVSLQSGSLTACNKEGIQPTIVDGIEKPPLKWKRWSLKRYYEDESGQEKEEDVEMKSWANTERYKQTQCINSDGDDISTVNDQGIRVPETKSECEELGHTWKLKSMGGWEVLKDGSLYDWCPSSDVPGVNFGVRCRHSGNPRATENTPRKFGQPMEGNKPQPITQSGIDELEWIINNGQGNGVNPIPKIEKYRENLQDVPLRKNKYKNVGMAKLNKDEDGKIKNVSVGLGYDHDHPESQRSKVLQRGNSWWGHIGFSPAGHAECGGTGCSTTYPGKARTTEAYSAAYADVPVYNTSLGGSYNGDPNTHYFSKSDGWGVCVCHPGDDNCMCGRRKGGSFNFPSLFSHDSLAKRRVGVTEQPIYFSNDADQISYTQKLYDDGKIRQSALAPSSDRPRMERQYNNSVSARNYVHSTAGQVSNSSIKNICEPPDVNIKENWFNNAAGKRSGVTALRSSSSQAGVSEELYRSSGSCLPRGVLPSTSIDFGGNGSTLITPYRPSELLRDIIEDDYDSFRSMMGQTWIFDDSLSPDRSKGLSPADHTKESIEAVRDFINNFSNLDEPRMKGLKNQEVGTTQKSQADSEDHDAGGGNRSLYYKGENYSKLAQLDQVVLPLHSNRKNMTIDELQEDAAQKCTDHINTLFSSGIFPEKWRSKTGFLLDTPASRIYKNPEGLFNQNAGNTMNLWYTLGDHTNANKNYGTGLRPNHSTISDGNINKPWICEPRVNLPKEITNSETEALYVSGIDVEELRRHGAERFAQWGGTSSGDHPGIHSASFQSKMWTHSDYRGGGQHENEYSAERSTNSSFDPYHRDATYKCENSKEALEACRSTYPNDGDCTSADCRSCVTNALTSHNHNIDCWMKAPDTTHVQWERLKCWEIFDPNFVDNTDGHVGNSTTGFNEWRPENRRQICERLKNRTINPVPYLTRDLASDHSQNQDSNKWYLGHNKIRELEYSPYTATPGTLSPDNFEKLWNGQSVDTNTLQGELRITREGVAKDDNGNIIYNTSYGSEEVPLPKRIRPGSGTLGSQTPSDSALPPLNALGPGEFFLPNASTTYMANEGTGATTASADGDRGQVAHGRHRQNWSSSLPASHTDTNIRTQGCRSNGHERYDGGHGSKPDNETCNFFINDANGKYVRLIGQDINGNPHYAKPDLSWHMYYKCDESWSDNVCKSGGGFLGKVAKNDSSSADEYLQGTSYGPKPALVPEKDLTQLTKPIWMKQEEWEKLISRKGVYDPNLNLDKPKKSKFSSVEYNLDQNSQEIISETIEEAQKNIYKVPPTAEGRPNNDFKGPFRIPPSKGGISDGALRAFIGENKAAGGEGTDPEAWTYYNEAGEQTPNVNNSWNGGHSLNPAQPAVDEEIQPCCGWVIVPHDALYPSERAASSGYSSQNDINKTQAEVEQVYGAHANYGTQYQKNEFRRYMGVTHAMRRASIDSVKGLGPVQKQKQGVYGLRSPTYAEGAVGPAARGTMTRSTQNDQYGGAGIVLNPSVWSEKGQTGFTLGTPSIQEFVGIFAPTNKPEEGPPSTGWELNPYRAGQRNRSRIRSPSVKITRGIDKDHTHRVCGASEGYPASVNYWPSASGSGSTGSHHITAEPLYTMQNVDGFSKNRIYRSWTSPTATDNRSEGALRNANTKMRHVHAKGGFYSVGGGKELMSPYTKQYTSHIGTTGNPSSNFTEQPYHPCRGLTGNRAPQSGGNEPNDHLTKDFFVLYDDSEEQLKERCQELNISESDCTYDYISTALNNRRITRERLGLGEEATETEVNLKTQLQNECRILGIIDANDFISSNPSGCTQQIIDQRVVEDARTQANTTISNIITGLQTAVDEITQERDIAARNWLNVDPESASAAGIEPYKNSVVEGFVNYPIVEGLCVGTSGDTINQIPDRCEIDSTVNPPTVPPPDCSTGFTPGDPSTCVTGCIHTPSVIINSQSTCEMGGNSWIEDTLGNINQEMYQRANNLLGNANNLISNFQATQTNVNQYNSLDDINNAEQDIEQQWNNFTISRNQTVAFRESTRGAARNVICSNIMNQLPLTRCITTPQTSVCSVLSSKNECDNESKCSWNTMSNSCTTRDIDHLCSTQQTETSCMQPGSNAEFNQGDCTWEYNNLINSLTAKCDNLIDNIQNRGEEMKNECELDGLWKGSCSGISGVCVGEENNGTCSVASITTRNECLNHGEPGTTWTPNITTSDGCQLPNGTWISVEDIKSRNECVNANGNWTEGNDGSELSDRCFQQPDESQTNVNIKDLSSFSNYINDCNNPLGNFPGHNGRKCGNIDDNNFPTSFTNYENEYNQLKNDYITNTNKFNDIKINEQLRLNLFKKVYGNQQYNQGYNTPEQLDDHEVSEFLNTTPQWLSDDQADKIIIKGNLETSNTQKQSELNSLINPNNGTNFNKAILNQQKEDQINTLNTTINNYNNQKTEYLQRPVTCRECIPCIRCNQCMTLSAFKNVNECPQCPHCNNALDREIRTQTNICENQKMSLLNKKDKELNESKEKSINNDLIEEKNSKLSVLRKKKILALSSERNCQTDRAVINVTKNEMINNIRKYQLKNDELKERIEWERNISWLDKLKGITKPFITSRDYNFKEINIEQNDIDDLLNENP